MTTERGTWRIHRNPIIKPMKTKALPLLLVTMFMLVFIASCGNNKNNDYKESGECFFDNPIDSIVQNTEEDVRFDEVYKYLTAHPDFIGNSDSIAFQRFSCEEDYDYDRCMLWKDCGDIRVYSIPCPSVYSSLASYCCNVVQNKKTSIIDTVLLHDNLGGMESLYKIKNKNGETIYIIKTRLDIEHQGITNKECINAFSIVNGRFVRVKLFHAKSGHYDAIEVECGGQRYLPLDYNDVALICLDNFEEDDDDAPMFVIAEINENDWPTGYGLKYQWNGNWFEYVGKCHYDADERIRDY